MRALAHPVRMRLLEELTLRGPLTATECAARVGESPSSCSFHLRMLAKYGFVAEAGGGSGRQRPWRVVRIGNRWQTGPDALPSDRAAADVLSNQVRRRDAELLAAHLDTADALPPEWQEAVVHDSFGGWLTAAELTAIGDALVELWRPYLERLRDPAARPEGARLVHMFVHGFPHADDASSGDNAPAGGGAPDVRPRSEGVHGA